MITIFPTRQSPSTPLRVLTVALLTALGGCTVVGDWFGGDHADYKSGSKRTRPLEVPPDLTQLQRDSRYLPQGGVVVASDLSRPGAASTGTSSPGVPAGPIPAGGAPSVALNVVGDLHLEHVDGQRWLVSKEAPEAVLPKVRDYWLSHGFTLKVDDPKTGILETDWIQNKTKLPGDFIHNLLGRTFDSLYDSGLRDRYRTRLERRADGGTEVYVTHFGAAEQVVGFQKSETQWVPRPSDPGLEAEQLSQLMLSLGGVADANLAAVKPAAAETKDVPAPARVIPSAATQATISGGTGPNGAARARLLPGQAGAAMTVDDNFDRSWRRIGLALDHGGFTVEDRDRAQGLYYVRYVDAKAAAKDEPGFFSKIAGWFGHTGPSPVGKYRISIKAPGDSATVTVLNDQGQPDRSENAQHIVSLLVDELK
ncbi:MAG: outer membrane protein assembly factor BamC [Burkholderiaceae bacterium]